MGKNRSQRLQIRPNSANGIEIEVTFCHPDYEFQSEDSAEATPTDLVPLLRLFSLVPNDRTNPTFLGRYDARDDLSGRGGASAVDVDVQGLTSTEVSNFKHGKNGFSGHHSPKTEDGKHKIFIVIPKQGRIFEGILSMNAGVRAKLLDMFEPYFSESVRISNEETGEVLYEWSSIPPIDKDN